MLKKNSSLQTLPTLVGKHKSKSNLTGARCYWKKVQENNDTSAEAQLFADINKADGKGNDQRNYAAPKPNYTRTVTSETNDDKLCNKDHLRDHDAKGSFGLTGINEESDVASASERNLKAFDTASDTDMKYKGMAKGHYVDKALKKICDSCQKQFKLKRKPRHCRRCGEVFCVKCVKYRTKLNFMAHPDPEGKLRKVCKACFDEASHVLGCTRSLTEVFSAERSFAKYARMINNRVNSLTTTFWPDQIDRRQECIRLISGFQQDVKQLGRLEAIGAMLKTPAWQKSKYWDIEIQSTKCRSCKGDVGLRKSRGNCRVCGLALCRKCSHKELLLFFDNVNTVGEAKIAVINVSGGPLHEPDISLLLYICVDCKTYISGQQSSDLLWYKRNLERNVVDDMRDFDVKFEDLKKKTELSISKIEDTLDKAIGNDLTITERRSASTEIITLRTTLNSYEKEVKTIRLWLEKELTRTEKNILNNFIKSKYDNFMECRYKCRALSNKLDAMDHEHKCHAVGNKVGSMKKRNDA